MAKAADSDTVREVLAPAHHAVPIDHGDQAASPPDPALLAGLHDRMNLSFRLLSKTSPPRFARDATHRLAGVFFLFTHCHRTFGNKFRGCAFDNPRECEVKGGSLSCHARHWGDVHVNRDFAC